MPLDISHLVERISPIFQQLQTTWDEIGECDNARDKTLLQLEQECLDIYRLKAETVEQDKADLQESIAVVETEIAEITSALGEQPQFGTIREGNLKEQMSKITLIVENLRLKKNERSKEILLIHEEIARILANMTGDDQNVQLVQAHDLTAKTLGVLKSRLSVLQEMKDDRLREVESKVKAIRTLSNTMSLDFDKIMAKIHPSLLDSASGQTKSISNGTLALLDSELESLDEEKEQQLASGEISPYTIVSVKVEGEGAALSNGEATAEPRGAALAKKAKTVVKAVAAKDKPAVKGQAANSSASRVMPKRKASEKPGDVKTPAPKVAKTASKSTPSKTKARTVVTRSLVVKKATPVKKAGATKRVVAKTAFKATPFKKKARTVVTRSLAVKKATLVKKEGATKRVKTNAVKSRAKKATSERDVSVEL